MAFQLNALDPSNSGSGGASLLGTYRTADTFADTLVAGYFNEAAGNLGWTHALLVKASDKTGILIVSVALGVVTVTEFGADSAPVSWDDIEGKPVVIAAGATQAAARTAIGAGTSSLTLAQSQAGIATKAAIAALVSPTADYADLTAVTAAIKSVIDALKA